MEEDILHIFNGSIVQSDGNRSAEKLRQKVIYMNSSENTFKLNCNALNFMLLCLFRSILDYLAYTINKDFEQLTQLRMTLIEIQNVLISSNLLRIGFQNEYFDSLLRCLQCLRRMVIFIKFLMIFEWIFNAHFA